MTQAYQEKCNQFEQIQNEIYLSNRLSCSPLCQCNEGFTFNWFILLFFTLLRSQQQPSYIFSVFKPNTSQNSSLRSDEGLTLKLQLQKIFRQPIYLVDKNKLYCNSPQDQDCQLRTYVEIFDLVFSAEIRSQSFTSGSMSQV